MAIMFVTLVCLCPLLFSCYCMVLACAARVTTLIPLKLGGSLLLFALVPILIEFWENLISSHFLLLSPFQNYHLLFTSVSHLFSRVGSMSTLLCFHGNQGAYCFFFSIFRFFHIVVIFLECVMIEPSRSTNRFMFGYRCIFG